LVQAKKTGNDWYVAGLTGDKEREVTVDFSFLGEGSFTAKILKDGPNSDRVGTDYLFETKQVTKDSKLTLKLCSGGGFVILIK